MLETRKEAKENFMRLLKQLVEAIQENPYAKELLAIPNLKEPQLEVAIAEANKWLHTTKSFEYIGGISSKYSMSTLKLDDVAMDLDDVIRAMCNNTSTGIDADVELWLIVKDKKAKDAAQG